MRADDAERNARQADEALLSHINVDPARVHVPGSSDDFGTPEEAAADYARRLSEAAAAEHAADMSDDRPEHPGRLPRLDIVLLGVGPDAHIASLFPEQAGIREKELTVVGVRNSPKPPPEQGFPHAAGNQHRSRSLDGGGRRRQSRRGGAGPGRRQPGAGSGGRPAGAPRGRCG